MTWPAKDANGGELGSRNGPPSQESELPLPLAEAINNLAAAIDDQNQMLAQIVAQNATLIESIMSDDGDDDDGSEFDLSGRRM